MRITQNIEMLEIATEGMVLHPVLVWDDKDTVLIDTILPGKLGLLEEAIAAAGKRLDDITTLILTHQDLDHVGCAKELRERGIKIMAHEIEAPYLQGDKTPVRLAEMEADPGQSGRAAAIRSMAEGLYLPVDQLLTDGEVLDLAGGIRVVHTPGHMPGHISLVLPGDIVAVGDASVSEDGKLLGPNPQFTYPQNMPEANASLEKLLNLSPKKILCFHGGVVLMDE